MMLVPLISRKISRGKTWGNDEVKALLQIWVDDHFAEILVETRKARYFNYLVIY